MTELLKDVYALHKKMFLNVLMMGVSSQDVVERWICRLFMIKALQYSYLPKPWHSFIYIIMEEVLVSRSH